MAKNYGRIYFPGNPWPNGHPITHVEWTARVERGTGIWFDLTIDTDFYDIDVMRPYEAREKSKNIWESVEDWCDGDFCRLTSTDYGGACGFLAGSKTKRLNFKSIDKSTFKFDDPPDLTYPRAFEMRLLDCRNSFPCDAVGAHTIKFKRQPRGPRYSIEWTGKISLMKDLKNFQYKFRAEVKDVEFGGIYARTQKHRILVEHTPIAPFVTDTSIFKRLDAEGGSLYVLKG